MCNNNSSDDLFDLVFGQDNTHPDNDDEDSLFSIINDGAEMVTVRLSPHDTSLSSLEEKYSNRVNIRIENID
jgi:hypothetical protein